MIYYWAWWRNEDNNLCLRGSYLSLKELRRDMKGRYNIHKSPYRNADNVIKELR